MMHRRFLPVAIAFFLEMAEVSSVFGAEITWIGTSEVEMNTTSNWSTGTVPGSGDDAIFNSTYPSVATNPTEDMATFSASTLNFPNSASVFTLNFDNQTLILGGSGITGTHTNTTINALNLDNTQQLNYQIYFSGTGGSATFGSAFLNITNSATLSGTSGADFGEIIDNQLYSGLPFYVGIGGSISVTNQGSDTTIGGNLVCLEVNQVAFNSDFFLAGSNTITILNQADNSGSKSLQSSINSISNQFSVVGDFSAADNLNISITNSGNDSSTGTVNNYVGVLSREQFSITGTTNLANESSITVSNSGTYTGSSTNTAGSGIGSVNAAQMVFAGPFIALDAFTLDVSNIGTNSATVYGYDAVGNLTSPQVYFISSASMGDDASIAIRQQGNSSALNSTQGVTVGSSGGEQLGVVGAFSAGDNFHLSLENSGVKTGSSLSFGSDNIGSPAYQSSFGSTFLVGSNATISITNSGQNSSNTTGGNNSVAYMQAGGQMTVQDAFTAGDDLTITISNSGEESSAMGGSDRVATVLGSQLSLGSTFTSQDSTSILIANSGTSAGSNGGNNNVGNVGSQVEFLSDFSVGNGFLLYITNTGVDSSSDAQGNGVGGIGDSQLIGSGTFTGLADMVITISNSGTNSGSTQGSNSVAWVENYQFHQVGALNVSDNFTLSIANIGLDSSTGYGGDFVGYINNGSQIEIDSPFTVGNHATITVLNSGVNSGVNSGSISDTQGNYVGYVAACQVLFSDGVSAGDHFHLSVTNSGVDSASSVYQDLVGIFSWDDHYGQVLSGSSFGVGDNATITVSSSGVNSSNSPGAYVGYLGDSQFYITGSFTAGDNLNLHVINSGDDSSTGAGGNLVGVVLNGTTGDQMGCDTFHVGDNATVAITNSGTNTGSSTTPNNVGTVSNYQLYVQGPMTAGDNFILSIENSGFNSNTGTGGHYVGVIGNEYQMQCASTVLVGSNATISISNSGTNTSSTTGNTVANVVKSQLEVVGAFQAGDNLLLSVTNTAVNSGNSNNVVGSVGSLQIVFQNTCIVGSGSVITAFNSGTVYGSQMLFEQGFTIPSGSITLQAINQGILGTGAYGIQIDAGSGGNANIVLAGNSLYIDSLASSFTIASLNGDAASFVQSKPPLIIGTGASVSATFAGEIQDYPMLSSSLTKTGSGTQTLSGTNSYSGGTTLSGGQLTLGNNTALGSGTLAMEDGTILGINNGITAANGVTLTGTGSIAVDSGTAGLSGVIIGGGSLMKIGLGSLNLSGTNTYTGTTTLAEGILSINGSSLSPLNIFAGAILKGTGTVSSITLESGATLAPGNSVGTMTTSTVTFNPVSIFQVEMSPTEASSLIVTGLAILNGNIEVAQDVGSYERQGEYLILDAGSTSGSFAPTVLGGFPGFNFSLNQMGNSLYLQYYVPSISTEGLSGNAVKVASYLNDYASVDSLVLLNTLSGNTLSYALNSISPSRNAFGTYITAQTAFSLSNLVSTHMDSFRVSGKGSSQEPLLSALTADSSDLVAAPIKSKGPKNKFSGWISGFGEFASQAASLQNPSFNFISGAALTGLDYRGVDRAAAGASLGYAHTHYYEAEHAGHGNINAYFVSIYGNANACDFYFSPAVWGIFNQTDNTRNISFPGFSAKARSNIFSWQLIPHLEVGYDFAFSWGDIMPFTSADWAISWQRGYAEHGASPFNAKQKANNSSMVRSETGLKFSENWEKSWGAFILKEKASYVFEKPFGTGTVNTSFVGTPGSFTVAAVNQNLNLGAIGLNFLVAVGKEKPIKLDFGYEGEFGASFWSSELMLTLSKDF